MAHSLGKPRHRTSVGVVIFFSMMRSYFCFLVAALRPCHGREPRQKYNITYPRDSMSSRRDCSTRRISLSMLRHMQGLQGRTDAQVGVDGGITSSSGQVLVLPIRDV